MEEIKIPKWLLNLDDEDIVFIKKFILCSGSLKEIANLYEVYYPTVRLRLDRLINKINLNDQINDEPFIELIKNMAIDEKFDVTTAKIIIEEFKKEKVKYE